MVNDVFFEPRARTHWHTHGVTQVLYVLAGAGWVQARGGPGGPISAGDTVHIPAGEEHWHGATADAYLLHFAVSVGETAWLDEVSDEDYEQAIARSRLDRRQAPDVLRQHAEPEEGWASSKPNSQ
jgi:mannose-6-phosphate isomerase-like protein (cupin superfamily)